MEDNELPPSLDDPDAMDDYWFEDTTITVPRHVKARLDYHRDSKPWGTFLEELRKQYGDPLTLNDAEQLAEYLEERIEPIKDKASMANDPTVDADAQDIINRLDDLEAELPRKVAEEVHSR